MTDPLKIQTADPTIELVFVQSNDRWSHRFNLVTENETIVLLTSIEGTPDQDWPSSPPLQDASLHDMGDSSAILCVGMAGKSHWSAAYSVEGPSKEGQSIKSDLACLQKSVGEVAADAGIGSKYELNADNGFEIDNQGCVVIVVELANGSQKSVTIKPVGNDDYQTKMQNDGSVLSFAPASISPSKTVATRWGFQLFTK